MRSSHTTHALCVALALGTTSGLAPADPARADAHFREGSDAFVRGDFARALESFTRADQLAPHGVAKYSAAVAAKAAGQRVSAHELFLAALASGQLSAERAEDCRAELEELDAQLARLGVRAPAGTLVTVGHVVRKRAPLDVRLEPGRYDVRAQLPDGRIQVRSTDARAGKEVDVTFDMPLAQTPRPVLPLAPRPSDSSPMQESTTSSSHGGTQRTVALVALGAAGVSVGAAGFLWHRANTARDEFLDSGLMDGEARSRAADLRTATNVAWTVAGVCAAAGLTLWLTAPSSGSAPQASAHVRVGPGFAAGRF